MKKKVYSFKTGRHSPKSLWGIFRIRNARGIKQAKGYKEYPRTLRAASSGMTTLLNSMNPSPALWASSPARGEENKCNVFSAHSVIPVLRTAENAEYSGQAGFTLLELLIVVLIIGILAAIAAPRYNKAIWQNRNAAIKTMMRTIATAQEAYYMEHGFYAVNFKQLDIDLPLTPVTTKPGSNVALNGKAITVAGSDSMRRGNQFGIVLNGSTKNRVWVIGLWLEGKYAGHYFLLAPLDKKIQCCKHLYATRNNMCTTLEHGTNGKANRWETCYDLP